MGRVFFKRCEGIENHVDCHNDYAFSHASYSQDKLYLAAHFDKDLEFQETAEFHLSFI